MRQVIGVIALVLLPVVMLQKTSRAEQRETLAAKGQVQENAPVKASAEITIHASPEKVWRILTDIGQWPKWYPTVSSVQFNGLLASGSVFTWKNGGTKITSRLALVEPRHNLAWTGEALGAHAVHVWMLEEVPNGTRVTTKESMDGFLLKRFYSSEKLEGSLKIWLEALKRQAELKGAA